MLNKLRNKLIKKISKKTKSDKYIKYASAEAVVRLNMSTRPAYAHCLYHAAKLAKKLNYKKFSAIEFGVAGGNGLCFLDQFAGQLSKEFNIEIEVYGFDLVSGLPDPKGYKDLPYIFKKGLYPMNKNKLLTKLKISKVIVGDVENSIKDLKYLVADSQTPRGLNEQAVKELRRVGFYKSLEKSLDNILRKLK